MADFTIEPRGPFTLASTASFIAGWPPGQADVEEDEIVHGTVEADNEARAIAQAARIVSLDHDGSSYPEVGERDPIVGELQRASGYLRPVLFHSPYEAAAWSVISARTHHAQATKLRDALSDGGIFPAPEQLLQLRELDGLPANKVP